MLEISNKELEQIRRSIDDAKGPRQLRIEQQHCAAVHLGGDVQPSQEANEGAQHFEQRIGDRVPGEGQRGCGGARGERAEDLRGDGEGAHFDD